VHEASNGHARVVPAMPPVGHWRDKRRELREQAPGDALVDAQGVRGAEIDDEFEFAGLLDGISTGFSRCPGFVQKKTAPSGAVMIKKRAPYLSCSQCPSLRP
jgi:hypothetical protein